MTDTSGRAALRRPHYHPGQLLTASLLNDDLGVEWERRWTHNRSLHGTGIVSGLTVTAEIGGPTVRVDAGHAIDPAGHELIATAPRTLQVPPLPGEASNGSVTPTAVVLAARWDETPPELVASGPCGATGGVGWLEDPVLEFLSEAEYPERANEVVALATVQVASCVVVALDFSRRRVLGVRPLPYVDAGVHVPAASEWQLLYAGEDGDGPPYGFRLTVDTSVAGFTATPTYQVRLSGRRWADVDVGESTIWVFFWAPDPVVFSASARQVVVDVVVPAVEVFEGGSEQPESSLASLVDRIGSAAELVAVLAGCEWAVSWVGVEGTL